MLPSFILTTAVTAASTALVPAAETRSHIDDGEVGRITRALGHMTAFDTNGSGRLETVEMIRAGAALQRPRLDRDGSRQLNHLAVESVYYDSLRTRFDVDGDGHLGPDERASLRGAVTGYETMRSQYDTNQDDELDPLERSVFVDSARTEPRLRARCDIDADGVISLHERRALAHTIACHEGFRQFDQDRDGRLSRDERSRLESATQRRRDLITIARQMRSELDP